jgi:hypothetical protein
MASLLSLKSCPSDYAVDEVLYGEDDELGLQVTDESGCPVDLTGFADDKSGEPDEEGNTDTANGLLPGYTACYMAKAAYWTSVGKVDLSSDEVTAVDLASGKFKVMFPSRRTTRPGCYLSEFIIRDESGTAKVWDRRYLQIVPSLTYDNHGPITIPEVRMAIMDYPCKNSLLEDYEFSASEVMFAIRRPVDMWNEQPPIISFHTVATFPYRENWLRATIGFLFRSLAARQRRNELTFQADTVTLRDNDKHSTYEDLGDRMIREYAQWMSAMKVNLNAQAGFISLGSIYSR